MLLRASGIIFQYPPRVRWIRKYRLNGETLYPFAAFTLAHRARAAAAIFLLADALIVRLGLASDDPFAFADEAFAPPACAAWIRAHRALAAAPILARPAALIFRRPRPSRFSGVFASVAG